MTEFFKDPQTEKQVLSGMLRDDQSLEFAINSLAIDDFYIEAHQYLFNIISRFYFKFFKPINREILAKWLMKHDVKRKSEMLMLFSEIKAIPLDDYLRFYIDELHSLSSKRRLYKIHQKIKTGLENDQNPKDVFSIITEDILKGNTTTNIIRKWIFDDPEERIRKYEDRRDHPEKYAGVSYGIKGLDEVTGGMQPQQLYLIVGRTAAGKCLHADSQLVLSDGSICTIQDIVNSRGQGKAVLTLNNRNKLKKMRPTNYMYSGIQRVYKLTTKSGRKIEATATHPLLTVKGWTKLDNLSVGDRLAVPREIPIFGKSKLSLPQVRLLAYLIAEGNLSTQSIGFTNYDPVIRKDFTQTVYDSEIGEVKVVTHGNIQPKYKRPLVITGNKLTPKRVEFGKNKFRRLNISVAKQWLSKFGLLGKKAVEKTIPSEIFKLPKDKLAAFLGVLWSCDGSIYGKTLSHITLEMGSPELVKQVNHLLLRFGILSRYWVHETKHDDKSFTIGSLEIIGSCRQKFLDVIGPYFIGEKMGKVVQAKKFLNNIIQNTNVDTIPMSLVAQHLPRGTNGKIDRKKINSIIPFSFNYSHDWDKYGICRNKVKKLGESLSNKHLVQLATSDIFWDEIISIEVGDLVPTYDIEMYDTHNFIANDIIVHNSRMLFNVGCNAAKAGKTVMYCTIEMDLSIIQQMWESREAQIPLTHIMRSTLTLEDEQKYFNFLRNSAQVKHPFYIIDIPQGCTTGIIEAEVNTFTKIHGKPPDIVLIDYANLIQPISKYKDRAEKYDHVFRELKEASRAHNTIYYTAAQMNRESIKAKRVGTEHVAFSDAASHHCDAIFHIFSDEKDEVNHEVHLEVIKGRYHQKGVVDLLWDRNINYIGDWPTLKKVQNNAFENQNEQRSIPQSCANSSDANANEDEEY